MKQFLGQIIFDTQLIVKMNQDDKIVDQEYIVDFHNEILENTNGMYAPIATIMNFLMQFTERTDILGFVL